MATTTTTPNIPQSDPQSQPSSEKCSKRDSLTEEIVSLEWRIEELKSEHATTAKETTTVQKTSDKQKRIGKLERNLQYTEARIGTLQGEELAAAELKAGNLRAQIRKLKRAVNMDEANRMLREYKGGHSRFLVAQGIVDQFVAEKQSGKMGQHSCLIQPPLQRFAGM